jgi:type I restriction enzyme M protein
MGETKPFLWLQEKLVRDTVEADRKARKPVLGKTPPPFVNALYAAFGVKDPEVDPVKDEDGTLLADPDLTDYENVPLGEDARDYLAREVLPHVPDAYLDECYRDERDHQIGVVGYEINFNRYFYKYVPPRDLHVIDAELQQVEKEIADLLAQVAE